MAIAETYDFEDLAAVADERIAAEIDELHAEISTRSAAS
jgi:hypothetical protein